MKQGKMAILFGEENRELYKKLIREEIDKEILDDLIKTAATKLLNSMKNQKVEEK